MLVSAVLPAWRSALSPESLLNSQGQSKQVLGLSDSESRVTLLLTIGLTSALDATSVIWFAPLELIFLN